jgi:hypothetical protein
MPPPGPCEANAALLEIATAANAVSSARDIEAFMRDDAMTLSHQRND